MSESEIEEWQIRCSQCLYCEPYLLPSEQVGCFCNELGVEIGAEEAVGACSYYEDKNESSGD